MVDVEPRSSEVEEFDLEQLERQASRLTHVWIARILGAFEELGMADPRAAAERADQASRILGAFERTFAEIERMRLLLR